MRWLYLSSYLFLFCFFLEINIEPPIWKITHDEDDEDDDNVH